MCHILLQQMCFRPGPPTIASLPGKLLLPCLSQMKLLWPLPKVPQDKDQWVLNGLTVLLEEVRVDAAP